MGNPVVVVDKADYFNKMENVLHDTQKFEKKNNLKNDGILNFAINQEKRVDNILNKLVELKFNLTIGVKHSTCIISYFNQIFCFKFKLLSKFVA